MAKTGQKGPTETKEDKHWSAYKQGIAGARRGIKNGQEERYQRQPFLN